jgi:hypothetical protein
MAQAPRAHLLTNSIVVGLDKFDPKNSNVCIACIKGKQHCENIPKEGGLKVIDVLGLIHMIYVVTYKHKHIMVVLISLPSLMTTQDTQLCIFYIISLKLLPNLSNSNN